MHLPACWHVPTEASCISSSLPGWNLDTWMSHARVPTVKCAKDDGAAALLTLALQSAVQIFSSPHRGHFDYCDCKPVAIMDSTICGRRNFWRSSSLCGAAV
jgi:hypothetical protein